MRYATLRTDQGLRVAAVRSDGQSTQYVDLHAAGTSLPHSMRDFISAAIASDRIDQAIAEGEAIAEQDVTLGPPVPDPGKIICIGLNYADHAAETGATVGDEPVVFCKFPTTIRGPGEAIELPRVSQQVDYEAELVVVIGKGGKNIPQNEAMQHVFGYTCGHDVSARDWQKGKPGGQWLLGKTFDSFAPIGPHLVTADEIDDPHALPIRLRLNGEVMQDSTTAQLIFRIDKLISYLSQVVTFEPGDLLFTGTPPGVGMARKPPVFLQPGDVAEVEIDGIGVLANPVVTARGTV